MITPTCAPSLFTCSRTSRGTRSLVLLGLGSMGLALPVSGMAEGFIDDTKATLNLRNAYINRNYTNPDYPQSKAEEWTQNFILDVKSADNFGRLGVAAKAKISNTELKIGEWMPVLPILRSDDGRSLPQTFRGGQITSKEIAGLNLYGGQFRANSPRNDASMEDMSLNGKGAFTSDRFNFAGGDYSFNEKRTQVGLWYAQLEDIYQQQFLNVLHSQPVGDVTLGANLGYFWGKEDGNKLAGDLDNRTAYALLSAKYKGNTLYVGLQKISGDDGWFRVNGTSGGTLANDSYNSSYDLAKERSWQVRHDLDFAVLGVPGLTMMNRYISGDNIHTGSITDGKEWGRESELAYTVQAGTFKDLNLRWRNASIRRDYSTHEFDENRIFISYPLSLL